MARVSFTVPHFQKGMHMNVQNPVRQEAAAVRNRIEALNARLQAAHLIRQSFETSQSLLALERIRVIVDLHEDRHTSPSGPYQVPPIIAVTDKTPLDLCGHSAVPVPSLALGNHPARIERFLNWSKPSFAGIHAELDAYQSPVVKGLAHDDKKVTHYCVTAGKEHGHGVFSAHDNKEDARYNAELTGGKCCFVERNEEGQIIKPQALREAQRLESEYC